MNNTVEYKGNVYEKNKAYLSMCGQMVILKDLAIDGFYTLLAVDTGKAVVTQSLHEINMELGTITKAPVKLIDGEAYQFDSEGLNLKGCYSAKLDALLGLCSFTPVDECTNIQHLTVGEK